MKGALPRGFRDILPTEARELHAIERTLMDAFARYGYVPLEPPTVEFAESDAAGGDYGSALRWLDTVEQLDGLLAPPLAEKQADWRRRTG